MKKKKIKILHVAQAAGGVDRYIRMLLKYLDKEKFGGYEFRPYDVLHHHFKGLSMLFIHGEQETGQHDGNHSHRRKACACAVFEQKEKRKP